MSILAWIRGHRSEAESLDDARAGEVLEHVVELANPRLRFARRYRARLMPAVRTATEYARSLVEGIPPARFANAAVWQSDRCMRSFFATSHDLATAFSRSPELRAWFDVNPGSQEACAVLSMALVERRIFGVTFEAGILRRDVPQTTVSFGDYRVRICAMTEALLREDIERRVVDQLALCGIASAMQDQSRREVLEQEHALLRMRLLLLQNRGAGMSALGAKPASDRTELARAQAELAVNEANLRSIAAGPEALDYQLERLRDVLASPEEHFSVTNRRLRLDAMNVMLPETSTTSVQPFDLQIARVPLPDRPPELRAFLLVRFPRAELLPRGEIVSEAARMLH